MSGLEKKPPLYERRGIKVATAALALISGVWAFAGLPTPWAILNDLSSEKASLSNTEVVLDASAAMAKHYGDGTMLEAAVGAVEDFVGPLDNEGLALRRAGGNCDSSGELLVDFGRSHEAKVVAAAAEQVPEGRSNLTYSIIAAIDDFADPDRFGDGDSRNRIVVVTSSAEDTCLRNGARRIRREVARSEVQAVLSLVALDAGGQDRARELASALSSSADPKVMKAAETTSVKEGVCGHPDVECSSSPPALEAAPESLPPVEEEEEFESLSPADSSPPGLNRFVAPKVAESGGLRIEVHRPRNERELAEVIAGQRHAVLGR
jgi:hypothetical protein